MVDKFSIKEWFREKYIREGQENEIPSPQFFFKLHKHLSQILDKEAQNSGDRMSYFSAKYPLASNFYHEMKKVLELSLNEEEKSPKIDGIDVWYTVQGGKFYGAYITKGEKDIKVDLLEINKILKSLGIDGEIPDSYREENALKKVQKQVQDLGIKFTYDNDFDIS